MGRAPRRNQPYPYRMTCHHTSGERLCRDPGLSVTSLALPGLIRDLHTTLGTGRDHGESLDLAVYLHTHVTRWWLINTAAPVDLIRRTVFLARHLAQERDEIATLAMATRSAWLTYCWPAERSI